MEHSDLPLDLEALRELALSLQSKLSEQAARLDEQSCELQLLREYVRLLKQKRFGRSSEKASDDQGCLFDEAELSAERDPEPEPEPDTEICVSSPTRQKRGRRPLPAWIPRVDVVHDLPESQKRCSYDGTALERMGEESSEQLEFIPAQLRVLRHVRPKYACPTCRTGVVIAPMPRLPIPKSIASPTLLHTLPCPSTRMVSPCIAKKRCSAESASIYCAHHLRTG